MKKTKRKDVAIAKRRVFKRLFFDIETSYCEGWFWRTSYNTSISANQIFKHSAIICICYKWEGEDKVHHLTWDRGDDRDMTLKFVEVLKQADEIIGHNSDKFDIRWFRTRCLLHGVKSLPRIATVDTLKISRREFLLPSNRLNDIGISLGLGGKIDTGGIDLWHEVIQKNSKKALDKMVEYCKRDVTLLEEIYNTFKGFTDNKVHAGMLSGLGKCSCSVCGSGRYSVSKHRISASGLKKVQLQCRDCFRYYTVTEKQLLTANK